MCDKKNEASVIFNNLFMDFLSDLIEIRPNDSGLLLVQTSVQFITESMLVNQFMNIVGPFSDKILNQDESFFLDEIHNHIETDSFVGNEIDRIKTIWLSEDTSDNSKKIIWNYLIALVKFGRIAVE